MELLNKEETELEDLENSQPIHTTKERKHALEREARVQLDDILKTVGF